VTADETFAVVVHKRKQIVLLLVGDFPGAAAHKEDCVKVIKGPGIATVIDIFGEQLEIGSDYRDPVAGLTAKPFDRSQGMGTRIVMIGVTLAVVPHVSISDGKELFLARPGIFDKSRRARRVRCGRVRTFWWRRSGCVCRLHAR
jgi:hypothetical protein